jgi:hypothetical protein
MRRRCTLTQKTRVQNDDHAEIKKEGVQIVTVDAAAPDFVTRGRRVGRRHTLYNQALDRVKTLLADYRKTRNRFFDRSSIDSGN